MKPSSKILRVIWIVATLAIISLLVSHAEENRKIRMQYSGCIAYGWPPTEKPRQDGILYFESPGRSC